MLLVSASRRDPLPRITIAAVALLGCGLPAAHPLSESEWDHVPGHVVLSHDPPRVVDGCAVPPTASQTAFEVGESIYATVVLPQPLSKIYDGTSPSFLAMVSRYGFDDGGSRGHGWPETRKSARGVYPDQLFLSQTVVDHKCSTVSLALVLAPRDQTPVDYDATRFAWGTVHRAIVDKNTGVLPFRVRLVASGSFDVPLAEQLFSVNVESDGQARWLDWQSASECPTDTCARSRRWTY